MEAVCHLPSGTCTQCDEDNVQATPGQAEDDCPAANLAVCDAVTHTCRACEDHSECFSGVCDAGTCVAQANVIYLTPMAEGGTDGGGNECLTESTGCLTLQYAIGRVTATRKYILFKPSATPYPVRNNTDRADFNGVIAHVIGYGAEVRRNGDGEVVEITGASNVTIEGLKIANATNTGSGAGIRMTGGQLTLFKAKVQDNAYRGISVTGGTSVRILRSEISGNRSGGVFVDSVPFVLVNNFITGNGDNLSAFGGVSLTSNAGTNSLEFNTIFDNDAQPGAADSVICYASSLIARNNIINGTVGEPHVAGTCQHRNTLYGPDGTLPGASNLLVGDRAMYRFRSAADFHLDPAANPPSIAVGRADADIMGESTFDIDGELRTPGGAVDVGADEIP